MKKVMKSVLGVTLLEIMLVLAIAAMIIVMSVRYYQSATANQQANGALQLIQGITATADGLAQGSGSYALPTAVSTATVAPLLPGGTPTSTTITSPWGGTVTISGATTSTYAVTLSTVPTQVCASIKAKLLGNPKYAGVSANACTSAGNFTYTYTSTN